jgi:hypothetical protein
MPDHLGIGVSNLKASRPFFLEATTGGSFGLSVSGTGRRCCRGVVRDVQTDN